MLTKDQAMTCTVVHANDNLNSRGGCRVWRRNGATQTWKRDTNRFRLPVKYGLYAYDAITEQSAHLVHSPEDCPFAHS